MKSNKNKIVFEIEEKVTFDFAFQENARNTAIALAQAGYFVTMKPNGSGLTVIVYKHH